MSSFLFLEAGYGFNFDFKEIKVKNKPTEYERTVFLFYLTPNLVVFNFVKKKECC